MYNMMDDLRLETPFAAGFPIPFRVLFLGGAGLLCWATNLHGLHLSGVDVIAALGIGIHDHHRQLHQNIIPRSTTSSRFILTPSAIYTSVYNIFFVYTIWVFLGWLFYRFSTQNDLQLVDLYKYVPIALFLVILVVLFVPYNFIYRHERNCFLLALNRCFSCTTSQPIYFSDVLLADVLTSFAKVIGDIWISVCMLAPGGSLLVFPSQTGWMSYMVPCLMSIPYAVRFKQCIVEYLTSEKSSTKPLLNATKYASSFPVIFLSAAQRVVVHDLVAEKGEFVKTETWHGEHLLFRMWLLAVAANSLFSFWWDITNDWGLDLLKITGGNNQASNVSTYPWGLRKRLSYPLPVYPLAIFLNLFLRLTWSIKLSSHLHTHADSAIVIFGIELAELLRRWMWVFFRVEWETISKAEEFQSRIEEAELYEL